MTDLILAALLLAGAVIGAVRGLFKSLMGLVVLIAALVGAVLLADLLTDPITDAVAPKVEDAVVQKCAELTDEIVREGSERAAAARDELLEKYIPLDQWRESFGSALDFSSDAPEAETEAYIRGALSDAIRKVVRATVHTVLMAVLYILLLVALRLAVRALDHLFDLPVLNTFNTVGGALLGLLETALFLLVVLRAANSLGAEIVAAHADEGVLLPFFLGDPYAAGPLSFPTR